MEGKQSGERVRVVSVTTVAFDYDGDAFAALVAVRDDGAVFLTTACVASMKDTPRPGTQRWIRLPDVPTE